MTETQAVTIYSKLKAGWSTFVVNGTRRILNGIFHGDELVPFPIRRFLGRKDQRRFKPKGLELLKLANGRNDFPFRNSVWEFWSTFQEIPFSRENFRLERKINLSIYIQSEISGFFWVNGIHVVLAEECTKIYNARAQALFHSLILFSGVLVAVIVVVCLSFLSI